MHVTRTLPDEAAAFSSISNNLKRKEKELDQNIDTMQNLSHGKKMFSPSCFSKSCCGVFRKKITFLTSVARYAANFENVRFSWKCVTTFENQRYNIIYRSNKIGKTASKDRRNGEKIRK